MWTWRADIFVYMHRPWLRATFEKQNCLLKSWRWCLGNRVVFFGKFKTFHFFSSEKYFYFFFKLHKKVNLQSFNLQSLNWTPMVCQIKDGSILEPNFRWFLSLQLATHYLINKSWSDQTKKITSWYFSCGSDASMHQRHQRKVFYQLDSKRDGLKRRFSGTSRGCCSCIPLVLFPSPPPPQSLSRPGNHVDCVC